MARSRQEGRPHRRRLAGAGDPADASAADATSARLRRYAPPAGLRWRSRPASLPFLLIAFLVIARPATPQAASVPDPAASQTAMPQAPTAPAEEAFLAAQAAWSEGRVDEAVAGLRGVVERFPQDRYPQLRWRAAARVRLGEIRMRLGQVEAAAAELVGVVDEEPATEWSGRARVGLATVWGLQGRHDAASVLLQEVVAAAEEEEPGADAEAARLARQRLALLHRLAVRRQMGLSPWSGTTTLEPGVELDDPVGVAVSAAGDLVIADQGLDQAILLEREGTLSLFGLADVRRPWWDADGNVWLAAGEAIWQPLTGDSMGFVRSEAGDRRPLEEPLAGATGPRGEWWIVDGDDDVVFRFGPGGDHRGTLDPQGDAELVDVVLDPRGGVLALDRRARRVRRYDPEGRASGLTGFDDWEEPWALDVDAIGNVYVLDRDAERIHVFDAEGNPVWSLGPVLPGERELGDPRDLAVGPDGKLYVADRDRSVIVVIE